MNTIDVFITDQYTVGRATLNLGVRFDHYDVFTPIRSSSRTRSRRGLCDSGVQTFRARRTT